jgi:hypothetical protein
MNGVHDHLQGGMDVRIVIAGKTRAMTSKCAVRDASWRTGDIPRFRTRFRRVMRRSLGLQTSAEAVDLETFHVLRLLKLLLSFSSPM